MSSPAPGERVPKVSRTRYEGKLELVTKVAWKRELGLSGGLVTGRPEGYVGDWGCSLQAVGGPGMVFLGRPWTREEVGPKSLWDLPSVG